jgi:hypothetical protein
VNTFSVARDNDDTLLLVLRCRRVAVRVRREVNEPQMKRENDEDEPLAHDKMDGIPGVASARDPPLVTVDNDFVPLLTDGGLDVGRAAKKGAKLSFAREEAAVDAQRSCKEERGRLTRKKRHPFQSSRSSSESCLRGGA